MYEKVIIRPRRKSDSNEISDTQVIPEKVKIEAVIYLLEQLLKYLKQTTIQNVLPNRDPKTTGID